MCAPETCDGVRCGVRLCLICSAFAAPDSSVSFFLRLPPRHGSPHCRCRPAASTGTATTAGTGPQPGPTAASQSAGADDGSLRNCLSPAVPGTQQLITPDEAWDIFTGKGLTARALRARARAYRICVQAGARRGRRSRRSATRTATTETAVAVVACRHAALRLFAHSGFPLFSSFWFLSSRSGGGAGGRAPRARPAGAGAGGHRSGAAPDSSRWVPLLDGWRLGAGACAGTTQGERAAVALLCACQAPPPRWLSVCGRSGPCWKTLVSSLKSVESDFPLSAVVVCTRV